MISSLNYYEAHQAGSNQAFITSHDSKVLKCVDFILPNKPIENTNFS